MDEENIILVTMRHALGLFSARGAAFFCSEIFVQNC